MTVPEIQSRESLIELDVRIFDTDNTREGALAERTG